MKALPDDDLLQQQHAKLMANAAWIQRQQMQLQLQWVRPNGDGDGEECHDGSSNCDMLKGRVVGSENVQSQRQERDEVEGFSWVPEDSCDKVAVSSPGSRLQSTGSTSCRTPSRRESADGKSPGILQHSGARSGDSFVVPRGGSVMQVQQRNALWQLRREQKLEEQRMAHVEDYSECTFSPKIGVYPERISSSGLLEVSSGVEQFIQRQERARKLAREKQERGRVDGSKWAYRLTVTEPFVFGRRPEVESLRPPVQSVLGTAREALLAGDPEQQRTELGASAFAGDRTAGPASLAALAATVGAVLPPPGTFSSWRALDYCNGKQRPESDCARSSSSSLPR